MPSTVESITSIDRNIPFFTVDLAGDRPFSAKEFDANYNEIARANLAHGLGPDFGAKFIVIEPIVVVFPGAVYHETIFIKLLGNDRVAANSGALVCAGSIVLEGNERVIKGFSSSLDRRLKPADSNKFKHDTLQKILGEFFTFEADKKSRQI
jgi:hypothetical protein